MRRSLKASVRVESVGAKASIRTTLDLSSFLCDLGFQAKGKYWNSQRSGGQRYRRGWAGAVATAVVVTTATVVVLAVAVEPCRTSVKTVMLPADVRRCAS